MFQQIQTYQYRYLYFCRLPENVQCVGCKFLKVVLY